MNALMCNRFPRVGALIARMATGVWLSGAAHAWADQVTVECPLKILRDGTNVAVFWQLPAECDTNLSLKSASDLSGPWSTIPAAVQPFIPPDNRTSNGFFRAELTLPVGSSNASQIAQSVRTFAFSSIPQLNPGTEFDIRIEPVRGLWEALQIQVLVVRCVVEGQEFNRFACVLHQETVKTLGTSFGGYGLMSGLVQGESFYFTYSWGSGIHRSHVGKLQIVNDEVKLWDSGGFFNLDLFLHRGANGEIAVESGRFETFNGWLKPVDYGRIDESDPSTTKLVGLDGSVLAILTPVTP